MKHHFHTFLSNIIKQIDGTKEEKADIYEEMFTHLQLTFEHYKEQGYTQDESEKLAIESFGLSKKIGNEMQEAMFPFRKLLLWLLSILSLFYSLTIYLAQLISENNAYIGWLVISVGTSTVLLLIALQAFPSMNRKRWLNSIFVLHTFIYFYGTFLASPLNFSIIYSIISWSIVLFSIILIYHTTIIDFNYEQTRKGKPIKFLHFLNITVGILIISITLFFLWGLLAFSTSFDLRMILLFLPLVIWVIAYFNQLKCMNKHQMKRAFSLAMIPFSIVISIIVLWIFSFVRNGLIQ